MRAIVTYDTHHGTAKRLGKLIADKLACTLIDVDTPYMAENETSYDAIILVFGFRGPYTAQLTKLFLNKMQGKLKNKHVIVVGEGIFSDKEFPGVAKSLEDLAKPYSFNAYFTKGELRMNTLTFEEAHLLGDFAKLTGMTLTDMGEFSESEGQKIADEIFEYLEKQPVVEDKKEKRWICSICGYIHTGDNPPAECPVCHQPSEKFKELN